MDEVMPTLDEWRRLYDATIRLKDLAPWSWVSETEIFGVRDPGTGDLGFVSVMGMLGEHYAMALYLGPEGLHGFLSLQKEGFGGSPYRLFEIPQLQVSFEDRDSLWKEDRGIIKSLGLRFRGSNDWPLFRSFRPGFHPWLMEGGEVRRLACALEQAMEVFPRYERNPSLLHVRDGELLVRTPIGKGGDVVWEDRVARVPPPVPFAVERVVDDMTRKRLEGLPGNGPVLEIDVFMLPDACREGKERPFYPYCLLVVESRMGAAVFHDMLSPVPSLRDMWRSIPTRIADHIAKSGFIPSEIRVSSTRLRDFLKPLSASSGFRLRRVSRLRYLDSAREQLMEFMMSVGNP